MTLIIGGEDLQVVILVGHAFLHHGILIVKKGPTKSSQHASAQEPTGSAATRAHDSIPIAILIGQLEDHLIRTPGVLRGLMILLKRLELLLKHFHVQIQAIVMVQSIIKAVVI